MNILLCCSMGFSTSILVESMREAANEMGLTDYRIASIGAEQAYSYLNKADVILVAPQNTHEYLHLKDMAKKYNISVFLINRKYYGEMDGYAILIDMQKQLNNLSENEIKSNTFSGFIERKIIPIATKVGSNIVLTIIRNAMCSIMFLFIIGSICVLLTNFPVRVVANILKPIYPFLNAVSSVTSSMMGLFTAASMAYYTAMEYKTNIFSGVITAISTFLLTQISSEGALNIDGLGSTGLVTAMVIGFTTVKLTDVFRKRNLLIKMPAGVPPAVAESFSSLIPTAMIMVIFGTISILFRFDINKVLSIIFSPLAYIVNNPFGYAIYHMLCALVFFCGINSVVVVGVVLPIILQNGAINELALQSGQVMPFIATKSTDILVWSGGTGATIGLVVLMAFFAKSKSYKVLGRMSIIPSIFNINEPIIFGTPICFNPIFLFPFVLIPGIVAFLTYVLIDLGVVSVPVASVIPWTIPPIIQGLLMSNGNIGMIVWSVIIVVISLIGYYPFFKYADKVEYQKEQRDDRQ